MDLYLMRHGIAVPQGTQGIDSDRERPLSPKGVKRMRKVARGLMALKISFDRILTSPLLRARQTADVVAQTLEIHEPPEELEELLPESSPQKLIDRLASLQVTGGLLLVGHQPLLGEIAAFLLTGKEMEMHLKKGGLCRIEVDDLPPKKNAILHWMLTSRQLRMLASLGREI